jgi:Protein of unknown function (DUF3175)
MLRLPPAAKKRFRSRAMTAKKTTNKKRTTPNHRWVSKVKTVSTFPPEGIFEKDAETIANTMADKKVSPKGIGSAIRMVQYFINRGGKGLPAARKNELEKAKHLLHQRREKPQSTAKKD